MIYSVSESIDELMEGLHVDTSNDITIKEIKDFKWGVIKLTDKFNWYIELETKKKDTEKKDIEKKKILKRKVSKRKITQKNISKK